MLLNLLIKGLWLVANMKVQDAIGHEDYGTFSALFALGFIFMALADLGVNQYATKTLAGQPERLRELLPDLFTIKLGLAVVYPVVLLGIGYLIGYRGQELLLLLLLCGVHVLMQLIGFFRSACQAFQDLKLDAVASILARAFILVILVVLLRAGIGLMSYTLAFLVSSFVHVLNLAFVQVPKCQPAFHRDAPEVLPRGCASR